jgi:flagellar biosynthetic protein FliO
MTRILFYTLALLACLAPRPDSIIAEEVRPEQPSAISGTAAIEESSSAQPAYRNSLKQIATVNNDLTEKTYSNWRSEPGIDIGQKGFSMLQGLFLCLGILLIGTYLVKRFKSVSVEGTKRRMQVLEKLAISPKTSLVLVEVDGKKLVLGVGAEKVSFSSLSAGAEQDRGLELVDGKRFETELSKACQ